MSRDDGEIYEQQADEICLALGYQVAKPSVGNQRSWDRLVNSKRVQIKKRGIDTSKPNNIRLVTSRTSSEIVYRASDVDVFAIYWSKCWFVIPSVALADSNGDIRNGLYMPNFFDFRRRWDVLDGARIACEVQAEMF